MLKLNQAVIVEGRYDKNKLSSIIDALIIEVNGFQIFKDKEKAQLIKILAKTCGIIIMTDSDNAGMMIRNKISQISTDGNIYHAYIPQILGKERRKTKPSAEGYLGVEGIDKQIIVDALLKCGIFADNTTERSPKITNYDLYSLGLSGGENSAILRQKVLKTLNLPDNISKNNMLKIFEHLITFEELKELCKKQGGNINGGQS